MPLRLAVSLLGGLAIWSAFPATGLWAGAPIGVMLITLAISRVAARTAFALGLAAGLAYFTPLLSWSGVYVGVLPWLALALSQALYIGLTTWLIALTSRSGSVLTLGVIRWPRLTATRLGRLMHRPDHSPRATRIRPVRVACAWVAGELARSHTPFGGFPWGRLAFSQADAPFGRLAALLGAPGVTFAVALTGSLLAVAVHSVCAHQPRLRTVRFVTTAFLVLASGYVVRLPTDGPDGEFLAVQGNVPKPGLDFNEERRVVLDNHVAATAAAARGLSDQNRPDVVIWPENSSDIDPTTNEDARQAVRWAVAAIDVPILIGAVLDAPHGFVSNTSLLYIPGAVDPVDRYTKRHPVPFAEYIPYRSFFRLFSDKVDLVRREFQPGTEVGLIRVPRKTGAELQMGINICFEVAADGLVLDGVRAGANVLVVQTNNATFGFTDESVQQLAISRIRAMEHGRSVVHISTVGQSALITPQGTALQRTALFTTSTLSGSLPLRGEQTLATRLGPWPAWLAVLVVTGGLVQRIVRRRR